MSFFFFETIVESIRWTTGRETEKRSNIFVRTRPVKSFPDIFRYRGRHSLPPDIDRENGIHLHHGVRSNDRAQSPSRTLLPRLLHPTDGRPKLDAIIARSYHFRLERLYIYFDDNSIISLYFNGKGRGGGEAKDVWTMNGTARGWERGGGRSNHNWSGFCYSDGDLMITRKDIADTETATDHPSRPIDR